MKLPEDFTFSQSNLQDYVDCPYRFYLRNILELKWPALMVDDALAFERRGQIGARFHQLIQKYLSGIPEARITVLAEADPAPELSRWWEDFLQFASPHLEGESFIETTLTTFLEGHFLLAKYDLILLKNDENLTIFDWKTSRRTPRKDWLLQRIQTRLYRYVLSEAGTEVTGGQAVLPNKINMNYWFATQPQTPVVLPYSQDAFSSDRATLSRLIREITERDASQFLRTEDVDKCRFCVYRSHCDRGGQAGDIESFDDFETGSKYLELDIEFDQITEIAF